jgi:WD40 repeat protein
LFSPDGNTLLLFSDKDAAVFESRSGKRIATISLGEAVSEEATGSAHFAAAGSQCFLMDGSGIVTRYDTRDWKPAGAPMRHPKAESAYDLGFSVSDDGKWIATYDAPGENGPKSNLQVWDVTTNMAVGKPLTATNGMAGHFIGNNRLLVLPARGEARVHELPSMKIAYPLRRHDDIEGPNTEISPDRKWILVWGSDRWLDLVDAASGKLVHNYQGPARISKVLMMPDSSGCYVVFDNSAFMTQNHHDHYVIKLGFPELAILKTFRILDFVLDVFLSPDGKRIMVQQGGSDRERLVFLNADTLQPIE